MRRVQEEQVKIGETVIAEIKLDTRSRDEIPKLLMGLQYIYWSPEILEQVFRILEEMISEKTKKNNGRRGMDLWNILVLGTIRLNCDWDYDKLREMADNHKTLRQMLGHGINEEDNVSLMASEILDRINQVVVRSGHKLVRKKKTRACVAGVTALWLKRMCIIRLKRY
jgi:hypothetical protein